jgi:hypothetical protein
LHSQHSLASQRSSIERSHEKAHTKEKGASSKSSKTVTTESKKKGKSSKSTKHLQQSDSKLKRELSQEKEVSVDANNNTNANSTTSPSKSTATPPSNKQADCSVNEKGVPMSDILLNAFEKVSIYLSVYLFVCTLLIN